MADLHCSLVLSFPIDCAPVHAGRSLVSMSCLTSPLTPKSESLTSPQALISRLEGLMSRCRMRRSVWRYCRPCRTCSTFANLLQLSMQNVVCKACPVHGDMLTWTEESAGPGMVTPGACYQ